MKSTKFIMLLSILFLGCKKTTITQDIISDVQVNPTEIQADGTSVVTVTAILNKDLDKRSIAFKTNSGSFIDSPTGSTINVTAAKVNDVLIAVAKLKAPSTPGLITLTVQPNIVDLEGKYVVEKTVKVSGSVPTKIDLTANSFSVYNNYDGEMELTGILTNTNNKGVSQNSKVIIEDFDIDFNRLSGSFRSENLTTKTDSKISAIYSPGRLAPNQYIYLVATVLNDAGVKTNISDMIKVFITKKD